MDKIALIPDRGVILLEWQNNSEGSSNVLNPGTKTTWILAISDRDQFEYCTSAKQFFTQRSFILSLKGTNKTTLSVATSLENNSTK